MLKPEIVVFAGPNGSGKSTIVGLAKIIEPYINADNIKNSLQCSDLEAAERATEIREKLLAERKSFSFETVLSTPRNLELLQKAKEQGYFIRIFYILTVNPKINVLRVRARVLNGGHDVPLDKIYSRYEKALKLIPDLVKVADVMHIYDNSQNIFRIFKKRKEKLFFWENNLWNKQQISELVNLDFE